MLSSIHPLGEAGRGQRWWLTLTAHVLGASAAGGLAGAVLGALGAVLRLVGVPSVVFAVVVGVSASLALAVDWSGWPAWLWRPTRQVNEEWLVRYRGWVYGGGYGVQLGVGVFTIVTAATVYVTGVVVIGVASPVWGAVIGGCFGLVRAGVTATGRSITDAGRLVSFHQSLHARAGWGRAVAVGADAMVAATAVGWLAGTMMWAT